MLGFCVSAAGEARSPQKITIILPALFSNLSVVSNPLFALPCKRCSFQVV
jgi:hypothetical protein